MNSPHYIQPINLSDTSELKSLVEHRRVYTLRDFELNIFETFQNSTQVKLSYEGLVVTSMMRGKKVLYYDHYEGFEFLPGTSVVVPSGVSMVADFPEASLKNPVQCATLTLDWDLVNKNLDFLNEHYPKKDGSLWQLNFSHFHFNNNLLLAQALNKLIAISIEDNEEKDVLADLTLKTLLVRIVQTQEQLKKQLPEHLPTELLSIGNFIRNHIHEKISMEELMQLSNKSRSSLFRLFKEHYNVSPLEFIIKQRIEHAKTILQSPHSTVADACYQSGFGSVSNFSKVFKRETGITPTEFILRNKV